MKRSISLLLTSLAFASNVTAKTLDIYFIDVEGGQATLIVTPERETVLVDAGWPGDGKLESRASSAQSARDPQRILAAARDAGVTRIDYLFITHFHRDHIGGVSELAQLLPIGTFVDHGNPLPQDKLAGSADALDYEAFDAYAKARARGRHLQPIPGDRIPLSDVRIVVVSADRATLAAPLGGAGATNKTCGASAIDSNDPDENPRSNGFLLEYGKFRFLDLGDLAGKPLFDLVCPSDDIGPVDVYLVPHHGARDVAEPATFAAFKPRVSVINNGPRKGGTTEVVSSARRAEVGTDFWQLHRLESAGAQNAPEERVANLGDQTAHWIRVSANADGSFRVLNGRTGVWTEYAPR